MIQRESGLLCDETSLVLKVLDMVGDLVLETNDLTCLLVDTGEARGQTSGEKYRMPLFTQGQIAAKRRIVSGAKQKQQHIPIKEARSG